MSAIFISYRRDDTEGQAGRLFQGLRDTFGAHAVFMDVSGIDPGRDFRQVIDANVAQCGVLLALIGRQWLTAADAGGRRIDQPQDFVRLETASALKRGIPVVPVLVQGAQMPTAEQLPPDLADLAYRNAVELTHARWDSDLQVLVAALRKLVGPALGQADAAPVGRPAAAAPAALPPAAAAPAAAPAAGGGKGRLVALLLGAAAVLGGGAVLYQGAQEREQQAQARAQADARARADAQAQADAEAAQRTRQAEAQQLAQAQQAAASAAEQLALAAQATQDKERALAESEARLQAAEAARQQAEAEAAAQRDEASRKDAQRLAAERKAEAERAERQRLLDARAAEAKAAKAAEAKAAEAKAAEAKAAEARAAQAREAQAREAQAREAQAREAQAREAQAKAAQAKAAEAKAADAKAVDAKADPRAQAARAAEALAAQALAAMLASAPQARADSTPARRPATDARLLTEVVLGDSSGNRVGRFLRAPDGSWGEFDQAGRRTAAYRMVSGDEAAVQLWDDSRQVGVNLNLRAQGVGYREGTQGPYRRRYQMLSAQ